MAETKDVKPSVQPESDGNENPAPHIKTGIQGGDPPDMQIDP